MLAETFVDKRLFERLPCALTGKYESYDGLSGEVRCRNISALGIKVALRNPLTIGSHLKISFAVKKGLLFNVEGIIRWCKRDSLGWDAGITFDKPLFFPRELIG
ncbi:MAG: PilZ domain-containing protein [Candidatus Omnitrophota bacterium]|nr:MAG: PilZ domain-containing protein [Candidatus Omnitrophota bacterium]